MLSHRDSPLPVSRTSYYTKILPGLIGFIYILNHRCIVHLDNLSLPLTIVLHISIHTTSPMRMCNHALLFCYLHPLLILPFATVITAISLSLPPYHYRAAYFNTVFNFPFVHNLFFSLSLSPLPPCLPLRNLYKKRAGLKSCPYLEFRFYIIKYSYNFMSPAHCTSYFSFPFLQYNIYSISCI